MASDGREGVYFDEQSLADVQREIYEHVQHLHDEGVINLDAPAREVIDSIDRNFPSRPGTSAVADAEAVQARAGGYWLVGDQGWCNHLT